MRRRWIWGLPGALALVLTVPLLLQANRLGLGVLAAGALGLAVLAMRLSGARRAPTALLLAGALLPGLIATLPDPRLILDASLGTAMPTVLALLLVVALCGWRRRPVVPVILALVVLVVAAVVVWRVTGFHWPFAGLAARRLLGFWRLAFGSLYMWLTALLFAQLAVAWRRGPALRGWRQWAAALAMIAAGSFLVMFWVTCECSGPRTILSTVNALWVLSAAAAAFLGAAAGHCLPRGTWLGRRGLLVLLLILLASVAGPGSHYGDLLRLITRP